MKTIHINEEIHYKLKIQAITEKKSIIELIEQLINEYLKKVDFKIP